MSGLFDCCARRQLFLQAIPGFVTYVLGQTIWLQVQVAGAETGKAVPDAGLPI